MRDTVLIVDDEKIIVLMNKIISKDYKTITAKNGAEGLEKFTANCDSIKLVVTDESMPIMSGSEMVNKIRETNPNIPVIFITSKEKFGYDGNHLLIKKPFNIIDLQNAVKTIMSYGGSGTYPKAQ